MNYFSPKFELKNRILQIYIKLKFYLLIKLI